MSQTFKQIRKLILAVDQKQQFNHQIKGKRIRKQLISLQQSLKAFHHIQFYQYILDQFGITFKIKVNNRDNLINMELKINYQYPFEKPQILVNSPFYPSYGQGRDLLQTVLGTQNNWGPSMLLTQIFQKLPKFADDLTQLSKQDILWEYRVQQQYSQIDLQQKGMKIFKIDQYEWKFMIKSTKKRVIGLTKQALLIFQEKQINHLRLLDWIRIDNLQEIKSIIKDKSLQLTVNDGRKNNKIYFGNTNQLQIILQFLDPIQMAQRRVKKGQKTGKFDNKQNAMKDYSILIEHYSLNDTSKTQKYMKEMKKLITSEYDKKQEDKVLAQK